MTWDLERAARLWNDRGYTGGDLAEVFGISRNAVMGLINRNRDKFERRNAGNAHHVPRPKSQPRTEAPKRQFSQPQKANQRRKRFHAAKVAEATEAIPVAPVAEIKPIRQSVPKVLMDLCADDCRWPVNDRSPFLFCCEEREPGSSYCSHHRAISKGLGTISERNAVKELKRISRAA